MKVLIKHQGDKRQKEKDVGDNNGEKIPVNMVGTLD